MNLIQTIEPAAPVIIEQDAPIPHAAAKVHNDISDLSFFEPLHVKRAPLFVKNGEQEIRLPNSRALVWSRTGELADEKAVSSTYTLTNHLELFAQHADILRKSTLPISNVLVRDEYSNNGMKAKRSIQYLDRAVDMSGSGDLVYCRTDQINSVNSVWAFQQFAGAYRSYCENSMVFGGDKAAYNKAKHTSNFDAGLLLKSANKVFETFSDNIDRFKVWKNTPVTDQTAAAFIKHICPDENATQKKIGREEMAGIQQDEEHINKKKFHSLLDLWDMYSKDYAQGGGLGKNKWALYNMLTHYATHTHDSRTFEMNGEEKTHTLGRSSDNLMETKKGKPYTLNAQVDRAREVALIVAAPAWQSIN